MMNGLELIVWFLLFLLLCSAIKIRKFQFFFALFSGIFITVQIASLYTTGNFFNYQFYYHCTFESLRDFGSLFYLYITAFVFAFLIISSLIYTLSKSSPLSHATRTTRLTLLLSCSTLIYVFGGVIDKAHSLVEIVTAEKKPFVQVLSELGISPGDYVLSDNLSARKGKNIIVISVESLEQGFLGPEFVGVAPQLKKLSSDWTFFHEMEAGPGGEWTAGSIYKLITGVPAFFKGQANAVFQDTTGVKITGLGHVLEKAGYDSRYLIGNAGFSGISDILTAYNIPVVSEKNSVGKYPEVIHGLHDLDLFKEAKIQVSALAKNPGKPFALFVSTVNSHFPDGIYDQRMNAYIGPQKTRLEFSIAAVDYLISDFVDFLRNSKLLESTAVYIVPDHYLMGFTGEVYEKLKKSDRRLFILTNVDENRFPKKTDDSICQIDLPKMILAGAGIKTNAKFLSDFISGDPLEFQANNRAKLTTLNMSSVTRSDYRNGFSISSLNGDIILDSGSGESRMKFGTYASGVLDFTFNRDMNLIEKNKVRNDQAYLLWDYDLEYKRLHLLVFVDRGKIIKAYLGDKKLNGIYKTGENIHFSKTDIEQIAFSNDNITDQHLNNNKQVNTFKKDPRRFIAHAGGLIEGNTYTNSLDALNLNYDRGFRLFELDIIKTSDGRYVAAHDWKHWAKVTGFTGILPPDRKTFLTHKLHDKYTPLDLDTINDWFKEHSDAILVTDKVNTPYDFSEKFTDRKRLMMELFTLEAVEEGIRSKILSAMPSEQLLYQIRGNPITFLKQRGISDIAMSRRVVNSENRHFIKKISDSGIRVYAFHLNFDVGMDELHVACNERQYFYGMYADKWDFNSEINCSNH